MHYLIFGFGMVVGVFMGFIIVSLLTMAGRGERE
jgi:uncharacterized membrane-anchored protein YhcB (DUF1043 family)